LDSPNESGKIAKKAKPAFVSKYVVSLSLVGIIFILGLSFSLLSPVFLSFKNLMNIVRQTSVISIVSIGMTAVIIAGGLDLSVGSNIALGGAIGVIVMGYTRQSFAGLLATLVTCALIGAINGSVIGFFNINPLMTTLATLALARGLTIGVLNAVSISVRDDVFNWLGGSLIGRIPSVLFLLVILYVLFHFVFTKNSFGLKVYAVGGNKMAARASGVKTEKITFMTYVITGILAGIGSIITVGRLQSAQPWAGLGLEFDVMTAVVIGGTSLRGGEGNMLGTFLGATVVGVLANGLAFLDLSPFYQYIFRGFLILIVVYIDNLIHGRRAQ
jgi:ribose/xylose/arabinose/galactoside ABC-type transport system permease subunit